MASSIFNTPVSYDFDDGVNSLKTFFQAQQEFKDFNFDGAAIKELLRILAYNEQSSAFRNNFAFNEQDIRTANIQENVGSIAAGLSYTPLSQVGAIMNCDITVTPDNVLTALPSLTIDKTAGFYSAINGVSYTFFPTTSTTVQFNSTTGTYLFPALQLKQGSWVYNSFVATSNKTVESFIIPNSSVDITTILVTVFPSPNSTTFTTFTQVKSGYDLGSSSNVYFLRFNRRGMYEIEFGDGSLAAKPPFGSTVVVSYMTTDGADANNISTVSPANAIGGYYNIQVVATNGVASSGGAIAEDIEVTRQAAPYAFQTIGNAVTYLDYMALTKTLFSDVKDVVAYGGENANPPQYGYTVVCVAPISGYTLTPVQKTQLINILSKVNVGSITPIIQDPNYIFIDLNVTFKYTKKNTILTQQQIQNKVLLSLQAFSSTYLGGFNDNFSYTQLISYGSNIDSSISNLVITCAYHQQFVPLLNTAGIYNFSFNRSIVAGSVYVNGFTVADLNYAGFTYYIADDSNGNLNLYKTNGTSIVTMTLGVGSVVYSTGVVDISSFTPISILDGEYVYINVVPDTLDQSITSGNQNIIEFGNINVNLPMVI